MLEFPGGGGWICENLRFSVEICVLGSLCHLSSVPLSAPWVYLVLRCFRASGTPTREILVILECCPALSLNALRVCKLVSRYDLVPISLWSSPFLVFFGLVVSYLVLQACISFYSQDFPEELQSLPSRTYPSAPDPLRTPPPGPDSDPILTWFWPDSDPKFRVKIRSKSGPNQVRGKGSGGGRVQRGRSGWRGSVAPRNASRFIEFQTKVAHFCFCLVRIKMPLITALWCRCFFFFSLSLSLSSPILLWWLSWCPIIPLDDQFLSWHWRLLMMMCPCWWLVMQGPCSWSPFSWCGALSHDGPVKRWFCTFDAESGEEEGRCPITDADDFHKNASRTNGSIFVHVLGLPSLQKCVCEIVGEIWLEFDLKFETSDGKNLVKFWGRTFRPARQARKISGGDFRSKHFVSNSRLFFRKLRSAEGRC